MPRQNRVTPFGEIIATPERGTFMGNRGRLHDEQGRIDRAWQLKRWLVCVLEFRGRRRTVMAPNRYTELFFLDEATALAAGHRPCAECRHRRFLDFCHAVKRSEEREASSEKSKGSEVRPTASEIDERLHAERLAPDRSKGFFFEEIDRLPDGVFVDLDGNAQQAYLVWGENLLAWSPGGYGRRRKRPKNQKVLVVTPRSTVQAIRAGYAPEVHASAGRRPG